MAQQTSAAAAKATNPGFRLVFALVAAGVAMSNLDLFVVNVAMPDISADFHGTALSSLSWVLNAYAVVFAALLVPAGSIADRTGPRRAYLLGVGVFTAASVLCAVAPGVWFLVGARVVQAAGAALLIPASLGILLAAAAPEQRTPAIRNWAALSGLAAALGPVIGGALAQLDWRWIFLINLPVGVVTVIFGLRALPRTPGHATGGPVDLLGAGLLTGGVGAVALGLVKGQSWGWASAGPAICLGVAVVLLALFALHSGRHPSPVLPLDLLRLPSVRPAMLANLLFAVPFATMLLSVTLWCQDVWSWSALTTGLAIAPGPLMVPLLSKYAGMVGRRIGLGATATVGCVLFGLGLAWWLVRLDPSDHDYLTGLLPGMLLTGIGVCLAMPTLVATAVSKLPPQNFSTGSALATMARQAGGVIGVAGLVAVIGEPRGTDALVHAFDHGWVFGLAGTVAATLSCCLLLRHTRPAPPASPARPTTDSVKDVSHGR
ncbi:MFS transporter [Streptomyces sp. NPDC048254]|uniref:MFS transporter n=1 Tax=Streptomyces sp. NPDC048254 TaxID=3365525 RepID=UPI003715ACC6